MPVVMAEMLAPSAGNLFLAAILPGFQLSGLYRACIVLVATFKSGRRTAPCLVIMGNTMRPRDPDEDEEAEDEEEDDEEDRATNRRCF
jgi:TRAP-type mannitol/chloroaromatic compound transport system permease large subunit